MEWNFPGGGGSETKVFSLGGMNIFWNYTILTVSEGVKPWGTACMQALHFEWRAKLSMRERAPHSPSACCSRLPFTIFALQRVRSQAMMGWTSKNVLQQGHFSISYLEVNHMYYKHMWCYLITWTLPPSSDHKPAKKGFHCHSKVSQHFRGRKTLLMYLKQSLLLLLFEM